ncbi:MAG: hypothetical protein COT18_12760 [Elusimicrobia bacterium CG08_land_8_20_14_0_20_59_10]|nr:MAG: hypothetical protein COT18_12760 [Elusimicrobia bacterium CG08_land_8_20_14_0_20_59_10]
MKQFLTVVICLSMAAGVFAAEGKISFDQKGSVSSIISQLNNADNAGIIPLPGNPKAAKEWTVMVFVNAKNNLESYGLKDVNEMEMVGSNDSVNVVAELGRINGYSSAEGDWKGSRRYLVQKDANASAVTSPVVMEILKSDMGSWQYLVEFINWTKANYPARKYALVIWNHGSGWSKDSSFESSRGISYDDETHHHITTPELRMALAAAGGVNILSMDACLMQMIEVAYEVKGVANYVVASEETEPGDGYTYDTMLGPLVKKPVMSEADLARVMVDAYTDHYQSINQGATHSAIKVDALGSLAVRVNAFVDALIAANDLEVAKAAKTGAQSFYYSSNKDMYHFAKLVKDTTADAGVSARAGELMSFLENGVISHNRKFGSRYANAFGLAAYLPYSYSSAYDGLLWAADSKWDDLIKWLK